MNKYYANQFQYFILSVLLLFCLISKESFAAPPVPLKDCQSLSSLNTVKRHKEPKKKRFVVYRTKAQVKIYNKVKDEDYNESYLEGGCTESDPKICHAYDIQSEFDVNGDGLIDYFVKGEKGLGPYGGFNDALLLATSKSKTYCELPGYFSVAQPVQKYQANGQTWVLLDKQSTSGIASCKSEMYAELKKISGKWFFETRAKNQDCVDP